MTTPMSLRAVLPFWMATVVCSSCVGGCDVKQQLSAVWAEDETAFGILDRTYETRPGLLWETTEYVESQLVIEDRATHARRSVADPLEDRASDPRLFFMHRSGYLLYPSTADDRYIFRLVRLDGTVQEVPASVPVALAGCPAFDVIPSPDGAILARVRIAAEGCATGAASSTVAVEVDLLDSGDFASVGATARLTFGRAPRATWTPSGDFILVADGFDGEPCLTAWRIDSAAVVAIDPPGCTEPPTASSPIAHTGERITVDVDGSIRISPGDPALAFGCQSSPSKLPSCRDPSR